MFINFDHSGGIGMAKKGFGGLHCEWQQLVGHLTRLISLGSIPPRPPQKHQVLPEGSPSQPSQLLERLQQALPKARYQLLTVCFHVWSCVHAWFRFWCTLLIIWSSSDRRDFQGPAKALSQVDQFADQKCVALRFTQYLHNLHRASA